MEEHHPHGTGKLLAKLLRAESKEIGIILIYGLGVGLLSLAVPVGVQALVNSVTFGALSQPLLFLILAVFAGLGIAAVFRSIQVLVVEKLQTRFFTYIALELAARLPRVRIDRKSGSRFPELVNRFFDVLVVQKSAATLLLEGFALILQTLIGLLLLGFYHPVLLAFDLVLVLAMVGILFGLGRNAVRTCIDESVQKYRVAAWLEEVAAKSFSFRTAESRDFALRRTDELVVDYLQARRTHFSILFRQVVGSLGLQAVASASLLGLGAVLVTRNQLTLGQLVAAEIVVTNVLNSLAKFQKHLEAFYDLAAGLDKIESLMELPLEEEATAFHHNKSGPAALSLKGIKFRYAQSDFSFTELSYEVRAGTRIALQGANGSGKSTLVDLLYGTKTPSSGAILIDGIDYREMGTEELRRHVAVVRGIEIISGTVHQNVCMGRSHISSAEVRAVLNQVGLIDEIQRLPAGMNTILGENGTPLSIAHAQRVMIARAMVGKPRLLVIDESLDALDKSGNRETLDALFEKAAPWTLILCTHDSDVARRCDETLSLTGVETGRAA